MIDVMHRDGWAEISVFGEFVVADFLQVEQIVREMYEQDGTPVALLFDLQAMVACTLDLAIEEVRFLNSHRHAVSSVAVVTSDQFVTWSAWLEGWAMDADIQVFTELDAARNWLQA